MDSCAQTRFAFEYEREKADSSATSSGMLTALEICAGGGGLALGLEQAGFRHSLLVENDHFACETLLLNRPGWKVHAGDVRFLDARPCGGAIDLLAGGVPCPPFSVAGRQLGAQDHRDLFPEILRLARECAPKALLVENVRGLLARRFAAYRQEIIDTLAVIGLTTVGFRLINASDYGVPQSRQRVIVVALRREYVKHFAWPVPANIAPVTVGSVLRPHMEARAWEGAAEWARRACDIGPTLVGGSNLHGGPDLGPTRARMAWARIGVDGTSVADQPPPPGFVGMPRLTVPMAAAIQGFPPEWKFSGRKTQAYRQVGNALPPPVAKAVGISVARAIQSKA
jgi:DNA (cytosine-5)-methyltransferase 1